ncbi:ThiJ/PfpI family protein [Mollisia scopiformis]|uniref:ThiJ/PfpI family protein n=1 Tax=Mollisia scopiformis TaxID=149040 RepID=A0A132B4B3_MOLSC|nr:ThiJ/PfpI family protein [Mollisia scopiformis]KUJ07181.1 ThiJ/PfpI family protein [Mollisia scopiformis]
MATTESNPIIKVLITMHPGMDTMDFVVPLEILSQARHNPADDTTKVFQIAFCAEKEHTVSTQGASFRAHMEYDEAHSRLDEFDILIVPGGRATELLWDNEAAEKKHEPLIEPLALIKAYSDIQVKDPKKERTLFAVCTGSMFLAQQGILNGLSATTHPDFYTQFENVCKESAQKGLSERCDLMEERYVVNNLRYDLGNLDENPYVRRKADARRPSVMARKGSNAWKESNTRRESIARRAEIKLGGLRVITTGGITCAMDASLYLVSIMANEECAIEIAKAMQYEWKKGIVVDGIDI